MRDDLTKHGAMRRFRLRGDRNQCPECGEPFNSTAAFDKHRTGTYDTARGCLSIDAMKAKGMALNAQGFWVTERLSDEGVRARDEGGNATGSFQHPATSGR